MLIKNNVLINISKEKRLPVGLNIKDRSVWEQTRGTGGQMDGWYAVWVCSNYKEYYAHDVRWIQFSSEMDEERMESVQGVSLVVIQIDVFFYF